MSKILITGATGVVGRRLVPILVAEGHSVVAMTHSPQSRGALERLGVEPVEGDFSDVRSLRRAASGCDGIVNLATHMPPSSLQMVRRSAWKENDEIRSRGSSNLVDAALAEGVGRFVQESFAPLYPDRGDRWIDEAVPLRPVRYNRSMLDAEASANRFTRAGGAGVVLRFAAFYGPDSRFLIEGIAQLRRTGRSFYPGSPDAFVSSCHHDDAATAAAAALTMAPGVYNVTDDEPVTRRDYFDSLTRALGLPTPKPFPWWAKPLMGSLGELLARSERISNRKLKAGSDWAPRYRSVREGWPSVAAAMPAAA